jgi:acetylornithine deacetylase/succinyl-diaminopimelate desuccinylase-like protein
MSTTAGAEAIEFAAALIRFDTTNRGGGDAKERPAAEFVAARLAEAGLDPVLLEPAPGRGNVVARVAGADPGAPALLLHGHLDVVPAAAGDWTVHPFAGEVRDGVLWGRGAVDMKNADAVLLAVVRDWARTGRRPARDIVLAFTADEEDTAEFGARFLVERHADLFEGCTEAIGESGAFTFHADGGQRLYPVASAERGTAWLKVTARGRAGHGAKPNPENAVTRLARAVTRIGEHQWPERLIPAVRAAIAAIAEAVGAEAAGADAAGAEPSSGIGTLGNAAALVAGTVRNSANPTMLNAGYKVNVIPGEAVAFIDGRVLPGSEAEFAATMDELCGTDATWEYAHSEVPLEAPLDAPLVRQMTTALLAEDPAGVVVPYCMTGGTDGKQFARLGMACYGFTPLVLPPGYDYYAMFHGTDERIPVSALEAGVRIMDRLLTRLCGVPFNGTGHAPRATAAAAQFAAGDRDDLDAVLAQHRVRGHVALIADHHAGRHGQVVVPVVPLFPFGGPDVGVRGQHGDLVQVEHRGDGVPQALVRGDLEALLARPQRPRPQSRIQVGVQHERAGADHGQYRVQVHHRAGGGQLDGDHGGDLPVAEQRLGEQFDRHRRGALPHPDHHRAVAQHVHVAALDAGPQVPVVVPVVPGEVRGGEHRVEPVDRPAVQGLPLPRGLGHRVHRYALVYPAGRVALIQVVGQRRQHEVVRVQHLPGQAVRPGRAQVRPEHAADQQLGQAGRIQAVEHGPHRIGQRGPEDLRRAHPVEYEGARLRQFQRLGEQLAEVVHLHAVVAKHLGEGVVLFLGPPRP